MTRVECEIEIIYKQYRKNFEIMERNVPEHIRKAHDFDKWKKKFFTVFNREKIIDFTHSPNAPFDLKHARFDPVGITKPGTKILTSNSKFWILYLILVSEKLTP